MVINCLHVKIGGQGAKPPAKITELSQKNVMRSDFYGTARPMAQPGPRAAGPCASLFYIRENE